MAPCARVPAAESALVVNYLLAAAVYLGLSVLVGKLPTGTRRRAFGF